MIEFPGALAAELQSRLLFHPSFPGVPAGASVVIVARSPVEPRVEPGSLSMILTHDAGVTWPVPPGEMLARIAIDQDGQVLMCFANFGDAMACQRRLRREGVG